MLANVKIKKFLKSTIFPVFTLINRVIPKSDKIILLYSGNKGISSSLLPLRTYMLDRGYHKKYRIYCAIERMSYKDDEKRVMFISQFRALWLYLITKHVFYDTGQIPVRPSNDQCVIQLWHGISNFKTIGLWSNIHNGDEFFFSYMLAPSDMYVPIQASEYGCPESCIVPLGDILCDELVEAPRQKTLYKEFDKLLIWAPTFRKSDYLGYDDSEMENLVPLFENENYPELNDELKKRNIKLIVKPHPAQNNVGTEERHFSHLDVYTHDEFVDAGLKLYPLLAQADGLIGDYSSVSLQYMLLDRPEAFVIPDIDEYGKRRGFVFKDPEDYMGGHIIKTKDQFYAFLDDFVQGKDVYKEKRHRVCNKVYKYKDAGTRQRVINLSGLYI